MKEFRTYLMKRGLVQASVRRMVRQVDGWLSWLDGTVEEARYEDLMDYIDHLRSEGRSVDQINRRLIAITHYYTYRQLPNLAATTRLRGRTIKALPLPIEEAQMEKLYEVFEGNLFERVALGLMLYQGIEPGDLKQIELGDIDLERGTIYIPARQERNSRTLSLEAHQVLPLKDYLSSSDRRSGRAFVSSGDKSSHLGYRLKKLSMQVKAQAATHGIVVNRLGHLRQSRIAIWVRREGVRQGQYKAGFKRVMSAERYLRADLSDLKNEIERHHPMG